MNTQTSRYFRFAPAAAALTLTAAGLLFAGPLSPPAGPVTSTYKTLTEVEPRTAINLTNTPGDADSLFKITQRGSYYLTGNIAGVVGRHGIEITASGVTLDLMGFDLLGVSGSLDGVSTTVGNLRNITIRNGSVRNWGDEGVDLGTNSAESSAVIDVRASGNAGSGIASGGSSTVTGCSALSNTGDGITTGFGSTVTGCTARFNLSDGISAGPGSTVTGCTAGSNTGDGITAGDGSTVTGCTARFNDGDGIEVSSDCRVTDNTCDGNGNDGGNGAGIHVTGSGNRIEGNNCTDADRGIDVDSAGNIIIRNTCAGNTIEWTIAANNVCGPILDRTAPASAAINGTSAPSSLATSDANANFTF